MSETIDVVMLLEDGSSWAEETLEALLRRMFDAVVPRVQLNESVSMARMRHDYDPQINRHWVSGRSKGLIRFRREIATHILKKSSDGAFFGFFFFHYDGDTIWSSAPSERARRFDAIIRKQVREIVRGLLETDQEIDAAMRRLIEVAPHYSIETWLFSATASLRSKGITGPLVETWEADLRTLDTLSMPKTALPSVDTRHYPDLARTLPIKRLRELGTSFAALLCGIEACEDLMTRLRAHQPDWAKQALADA